MHFGLRAIPTCSTFECCTSRLWPQLSNTKSSTRRVSSNSRLTLHSSIKHTLDTTRHRICGICQRAQLATAPPFLFQHRSANGNLYSRRDPHILNNISSEEHETSSLQDEIDSNRDYWMKQRPSHGIERFMSTPAQKMVETQQKRKSEYSRVGSSLRERKPTEFERRNRSWRFLSAASVASLEKELLRRAHERPHPVRIRTLLTLLIQEHKVLPARRHYEALLLANCSPAGSAKQIREIWTEMQTGGIDMSASVLLAALSALAIHPDLLLQEEILSAFDERWLSSSIFTQYYLIISLLRSDQLELANMLLNDLHSSQQTMPITDRIPIPLFLYVVFLQHLIEKRDYDASIRFIYKLRDRNAIDMDLPAGFWSWVLQRSASDGDGWVSAWIWQEWVETMRIRPSRQSCHDMMRIAVRDKILWLAESVKDTIEHGGVAVTLSTHEQNPLPLNALSDDEKRLLGGLQGTKTSSASPFKVDATETAGLEGRYDLGFGIRRGNMWPYFDHDAEYGSGRFDPWDALGPKSRRR